MKIIISLAIILLLIYSGVITYFYIELFTKNSQLNFLLGEAQDLKIKLQDEIARRESLQLRLQEENEQLKKQSLLYLEQEKRLNKRNQEIKEFVRQQNKKIKNLKEELEVAKKELAELKDENLRLADMKNFLGNIQIKKQEKRIKKLEEDLSHTKEKIKKQEALLHYNLGVAYTKDRNYEMAIDEYERALSLNLEDADIHYNLAILYDEVRRNSKRAIEHFQRYLELKPDAEDIDIVKDWIANLMLAQTKPKTVELEVSPSKEVSQDMSRQEKIKGIFLKKVEEIPQRP